MRRRFRVSNYQSTTRVRPFQCSMPIGLNVGWNQIQFNLADFTRRAYGSNYLEATRLQIHASCRVRRIYFSDRLYSEDELPPDFKLYMPISNTNEKHAVVAARRASMAAERRASLLEKIAPPAGKPSEPPSGPPDDFFDIV